MKNVFQYAVFAAYHLSLETSFLADEGASLPKVSVAIPEMTSADNAISVISHTASSARHHRVGNGPHNLVGSASCNADVGLPVSLVKHHYPPFKDPTTLDDTIEGSLVTLGQGEFQPSESPDLSKFEISDEFEPSNESYSAADSRQSILVSFSSRCILNGNVCERSRLLRIKFYGSFDKPLGRFLLDDLFGQVKVYRSHLVMSNVSTFELFMYGTSCSRYLPVNHARSQLRTMSFVIHTSKGILLYILDGNTL